MSFMELAKKRFSTRAFSAKAVEQEKLGKILEAADIAPTAKNIQPWRIYVVRSEEAIRKLDELTPCRYGAPVVLIFTYNKDEEWHNPSEPEVHAGVEDVSIAAVHAMLEAEEQGLSTCWVNMFPNTKLEKKFDLPDNERSVLLLPVGYPMDNAKPSPNHEKCRPVDELVKYL